MPSGRYPSGQRGQTVNLLANAFGGSNPPLPTTDTHTGGNSSAVERQPSKLGVAGSNPVSRSMLSRSATGFLGRCQRLASSRRATGVPGRAERLVVWGPCRGPQQGGHAPVAQTVERVLGKDEVSGSIPDMGSIIVASAAVDGRN